MAIKSYGFNQNLFLDKTPPVVKNCPVSPTFVSKGGAQVNVTWKEPSFKDNVKIQNIDVIGENGIMRNPTSFNVRYSAVDTSGNTALCKFTVYFNGKWFQDLRHSIHL